MNYNVDIMKCDTGFAKDYLSGQCRNAYEYLGSRPAAEADGVACFAVWAPNALSVRVVGEFNGWGSGSCLGDELQKDEYGFYRTELTGLREGTLYKYRITGADGNVVYKNDPFCYRSEYRPGTASVLTALPEYEWHDTGWLEQRAHTDVYSAPVNIYELHPGSWRRGRIPGIDYENNWPEAERRRAEEPFLNYRELADELAAYLGELNYTHVELMPVCEHPLDGSWGYQTGNYYSLTSRYGTPSDFMYFVDRLHAAGIGVIIDWVPGHFCKDESWLTRFDGTFLYEYDAENKRENPLWGTANFDLGKGPVKSFLISNALYWLKKYHVDGLRVDAVANIIYYDYNCMHRDRPVNAFGGNDNPEGIAFLRELNVAVHAEAPGSITVAEDSSTYPGITAPVFAGGLGFDLKWDMGWMNDTLKYLSEPPERRRYIHNKLTFSMMYAHTERFLLSVSHDEAVHGKRTLLDKMYGPLPDKFLQLRTFLVYMMTHPGKKLLFMGSEFGQIMEWRYYEALEWKMLLYPPHGQLKEFTAALNKLYRSEPALYSGDYRGDGFFWIDADDAERSVYSYVRNVPGNDRDFLVIALNFSPNDYHDYCLGVPRFCDYCTVFTSFDAGTKSAAQTQFRPLPSGRSGQPFHVKLELPAYGAVILKPFFSY